MVPHVAKLSWHLHWQNCKGNWMRGRNDAVIHLRLSLSLSVYCRLLCSAAMMWK